MVEEFCHVLKIVDTIYRPLKINWDNNATVSFPEDYKISNVIKHKDIKYLVVLERV